MSSSTFFHWVALFLLSTELAFADGPFGMNPGDPVTSLSVINEIEPFRFAVEAPKPHPELNLYVVKVTPQDGICQINAAGKDHENDGYGIAVRTAFDTLKSQLEKRYGPGEDNSVIRTGALWTEADEWVMSIRQNERSYQFIWENVPSSSVPQEISEIILGVSALSSDTAYVTLQYRFSNYEACAATIAAAAGSNL